MWAGDGRPETRGRDQGVGEETGQAGQEDWEQGVGMGEDWKCLYKETWN